MPLTHRLQLLLEEDQYARLAHRAQTEGCSIGALVRHAIDLAWAEPDSQRRLAADVILQAPAMSVPDVADLRTELADTRAGRFE